MTPVAFGGLGAREEKCAGFFRVALNRKCFSTNLGFVYVNKIKEFYKEDNVFVCAACVLIFSWPFFLINLSLY